MSESLIQRAELLLSQQRHDEASEILASLLAQDPNNTIVLSMLSEVSLQQGKPKDSLEVINNAIRLAPDEDHLHYQKARILLDLKKYDEAEKSLDNAITYNPYDADHFALWSSIKIARKKYADGLDLANKALEIDSENLLALNNRSKALLKLDRKDESSQTIDGALNRDPNNAFTHTTIGWNELENGSHKKALHHFKEALKNDPNFTYAQAGMLQALKAKYLVYRWFLAYSFWISNMGKKYQWGFIIGFYVGFRVLRTVADSSPGLAPFLEPLLMILMILAFSSWIIAPLSNLFLRLNYYGRHLLSEDEKTSANLVGICASIFVIGLAGLLLSTDPIWTGLTIFGFAMMIPCSTVFASSRQQYTLPLYTVGLAICGLLALYQILVTDQLTSIFSTIFLLGVFAFQWLANYLIINEDNI
ncbi:MAG: tetratricopeptide repeat protein [Marinoscillum sp.]